MNKAFLLLAILTMPIFGVAQTPGVVELQVIAGNIPISGALVTFSNNNTIYNTSTDEGGYAYQTYTNIYEGENITITISAEGYHNRAYNTTITNGGNFTIIYLVIEVPINNTNAISIYNPVPSHTNPGVLQTINNLKTPLLIIMGLISILVFLIRRLARDGVALEQAMELKDKVKDKVRRNENE